jgi:hypothetical protein
LHRTIYLHPLTNHCAQGNFSAEILEIFYRNILEFVYFSACLRLALVPYCCSAALRIPLCDAAALPGRFLPELGRSLGSGRSFFGAARARAKDVSANTRPKDFFSTVIPS